MELVVATGLSVVIDLDHFIEAKSLSLKVVITLKVVVNYVKTIQDAVSLPNRPFLHCSSIPVIILAATSIGALFSRHRLLHRAGLLIFSCFFSHHLRDASRRGLWFYGLPTIHVSYNVYVIFELSLPLVYRYLLSLYPIYKQTPENIIIV